MKEFLPIFLGLETYLFKIHYNFIMLDLKAFRLSIEDLGFFKFKKICFI